jgi:hypothetical protein
MSIRADMSSIDIAVDNSTLYLGYSNRATENYGPVVMKGTINSNNISFSSASEFSQPFTEGKLIHGISIAAKGGKVYAIIDDKDTVLIQYFIFDNILQPASYFLGQDKTGFAR